MNFSNRKARKRVARVTAEKAIDLVEQSAHREFINVAQRAGVWLAGKGEPFTAADVRDAMQRNYPNVKTHDDRALGAVMRGLAKRGVISATGRYVKSNRLRNHNRPLREWVGRE